jgi:hypothetical protein
LEKQLSTAQHERMRKAFRQVGPEAVAGFRAVLEAMMDQDMRFLYNDLRNDGS